MTVFAIDPMTALSTVADFWEVFGGGGLLGATLFGARWYRKRCRGRCAAARAHRAALVVLRAVVAAFVASSRLHHSTRSQLMDQWVTALTKAQSRDTDPDREPRLVLERADRAVREALDVEAAVTRRAHPAQIRELQGLADTYNRVLERTFGRDPSGGRRVRMRSR